MSVWENVMMTLDSEISPKNHITNVQSRSRLGQGRKMMPYHLHLLWKSLVMASHLPRPKAATKNANTSKFQPSLLLQPPSFLNILEHPWTSLNILEHPWTSWSSHWNTPRPAYEAPGCPQCSAPTPRAPVPRPPWATQHGSPGIGWSTPWPRQKRDSMWPLNFNEQRPNELWNRYEIGIDRWDCHKQGCWFWTTGHDWT